MASHEGIVLKNFIPMCESSSSETDCHKATKEIKGCQNASYCLDSLEDLGGGKESIEETVTVEKLKEKSKKFCNELCSVDQVKRRLPFTKYITNYKRSWLAGDLIAGLTVALMIIPQGLAYALVAGLTPTRGMYSCLACGFLYFLFGSVAEASIGPAALTALMSYQYSSRGGADYAILLCFLSGCITIIAGILNLGFLMYFISEPVINGFTSAAALTIASSQLKNLFGLSVNTQGFVDSWIKVCSNLSDTRWQDLSLGLVCMIILIFMKQMRGMNFKCLLKVNSDTRKVLRQVIFYLSVGRNALVVIISAAIAYQLDGPEQPFILTGVVEPGLPNFTFPAFSTTINNQTLGPSEMLSDLGVGIFAMSFIPILNHIAVVSVVSKGKSFDASQEIIALGIINLVTSFFGGFTNTSSLSRSAVNKTSGVRTTAGGLVTNTIVIMALLFVTSSFRYIPRTTLTAVIISAVVTLFDYRLPLLLWKTSKLDFGILLITFISCLFWGLEWGLILGILMDLLVLLIPIARPKANLYSVNSEGGPALLHVLPESGFFFPGMKHFRERVIQVSAEPGKDMMPVVIDGSRVSRIDFTAAKGIQELIEELECRKRFVIFAGFTPSVKARLSGVIEGIRFCDTLDNAKMILKKDHIQNSTGDKKPHL